MKVYLLLLLLQGAFHYGSTESEIANFIVDYIKSSELQVRSYNILLCNDVDHQKLKIILSSCKKLFQVKSPTKVNVSDWKISHDPEGFIIDLSCSEASFVLEQASSLELFRRPYSWLLLGKESDGTALVSENEITTSGYNLESLNIRLDSLVVVAKPMKNEIIMDEVYKIREELPLLVMEFGKWANLGGIQVHSKDIIAQRRRDLNGTTLMATIIINHLDILDHLQSLKNRHHDSASRLTYEVVLAVAKYFNMKIELIVTDSWGSLTPEGTWTGMVGHLVEDKADVGCCPLFITPQRMEVVDYIHGLWQARTAFIATAPPLSYSSNLFTLPFSSSVWISSVGLIIITSILLYITTLFENEKINGVVQVDKETLGANWADIAMLNLGAICQQGCDAEPKGPSGRMVAIILYFAVMFLYVSYSASIVALLQSSDTSIKTLKDLLESPLQCGAEDIAYQRFWFKASTDPVRREFYRKKIAPKGDAAAHFYTIEEGIKRVRQGLYAFHVEVSPGYLVVQQTFTESEKCGIQELPSFIQVPEPWVPIKKNSPFLEMFKIGSLMARELGIESRASNRLYTKKPACSAPGTNFVSVGLMDSYHLFLILSYGVISSMILVVIERLVIERLKRRAKEMKNAWMNKTGVSKEENGIEENAIKE